MKQVKSYRHILNMGEVAVAADPGEIICYGLGSCVGVFLYDKFQRVGAGAHVALPASQRHNESEVMIHEVIRGMLKKGSSILTMRAKLVGGANIMNITRYQVGLRNTEYIKAELKKWGIMVQAEDTGGTISRTARLDVQSGELAVSTLNKNRYKI